MSRFRDFTVLSIGKSINLKRSNSLQTIVDDQPALIPCRKSAYEPALEPQSVRVQLHSSTARPLATNHRSTNQTNGRRNNYSFPPSLNDHVLAGTMLQQILKDMYVDPDLLEALSDQERQVLFVKIREEQVRRWNEFEDELEKKGIKFGLPDKERKSKKNKKGSIDFLKGSDNNDWVWVMGDHSEDRSVEEILDDEERQKAYKMAEIETETLRQTEPNEEELVKALEAQHIAEEQKKTEDIAALLNQKLEQDRAAKLESPQARRRLDINPANQKSDHSRLLRHRPIQKQLSSEELTHRRSIQIQQQFKVERQKLEQQAKAYCANIEAEWVQQERKAKEAEAAMSTLARQARAEHQHSIKKREIHKNKLVFKRVSVPVPAEPEKTQKTNVRPATTPKPMKFPVDPPRKTAANPAANPVATTNLTRIPHTSRPVEVVTLRTTDMKQIGKPRNHSEIINWFQRSGQCDAVKDIRGDVEAWFHGLISRDRAEEILSSCQCGSYLIRVSERVWGYAVSYKGDTRCKHFLIDASVPHSYQLFGIEQITYNTIQQLIEYHKTNPISLLGKELLLYPCGQVTEVPDYLSILSDGNNNGNNKKGNGGKRLPYSDAGTEV